MDDPNEALKEMRYLLVEWRHDDATPDDLNRIAELADGLDQWLSRGGFPPEAWREGPDAFGEANPDDDKKGE